MVLVVYPYLFLNKNEDYKTATGTRDRKTEHLKTCHVTSPETRFSLPAATPETQTPSRIASTGL